MDWQTQIREWYKYYEIKLEQRQDGLDIHTEKVTKFHECTENDFVQFGVNKSLEDEKNRYMKGFANSKLKVNIKYFCVKGFEDFFVSG